MLLLVLVAAPVWAVNPDEILSDPALEDRARVLSKDLRCVVCRNQSIDDSNAGIARDMRIALRERLLAGDDDVQVMAYMRDRYGDYILLKPPLKPVTYLLWGGPALILLLTIWGFSGLWRKRVVIDEPDISAEERDMIRDLLKDEKASN